MASATTEVTWRAVLVGPSKRPYPGPWTTNEAQARAELDYGVRAPEADGEEPWADSYLERRTVAIERVDPEGGSTDGR